MLEKSKVAKQLWLSLSVGGGGGGIIYNFKYKSRRLFRVGVKSRSYT